MKKFFVLPTWLSVLSFSIALFVPLGVGLIADTSADEGSRSNIVLPEYGRDASSPAWFTVPIEPTIYRIDQKRSGEDQEADRFNHRV